jgi:glycosyltransferase involved in cell wall biosynthesis
VVTVSVVTPTHRGGPHLREAVESVLKQTWDDWELVVVADGCPDPLDDLLDLDPRVRVVRQPRRGISIARNVGIRESRAAYIAFLDHDDLMEPSRLEQQLELLGRESDAVFCHTQFSWIDEAGELLAPGNSWDVQYRDLLRGHLQILLPTVMVRRHVLEEVGGFDPMWDGLGDLDLGCRVARDHRLTFLDVPLTRYRRHAGNYSGHPLTSWMEIASLLRKHRRWALQQHQWELALEATRGLRRNHRENGRGAYRSARDAWRDGDIVRSSGYLALGLALAPSDSLAEAALKLRAAARRLNTEKRS